MDCHLAHENASRRIPYAALPQCSIDLAVRVGTAAEDYLTRTYPEVDYLDPDATSENDPVGVLWGGGRR
jgi:hypothetical protein